MSGPEEKELLRMAIKDGNFWINASPDASKSKNKPGEKQEEDWENIDYALWLVVKSFKNPYSNKSVSTDLHRLPHRNSYRFGAGSSISLSISFSFLGI